jgi:nitrogen PTS system EIIA component
MNLKIKDIIELLNVSEKTVYRWINEGKIPVYKIGGQYRFSETEINEWIINNKLENNLNLSKKVVELTSPKKHVSLSEIIKNGGIFYNVSGNNAKEIIKNCVDMIHLPEDMNREKLLKLIIERENLMPTAIGRGIAIPHPRNPIIADVEDESLSICFTKNEIDYGAIDGNKVHTLFIILSANPRRHLEILSKISYLTQDEVFMNLIKNRDKEENIINYLKEKDKVWVEG